MISTALHPKSADPTRADALPLVSLVIPAYDEAAILARNLDRICAYMRGLETRYRWEIVLVNDGSNDATGALADAAAAAEPRVRVYHHDCNRGVGQAFRTAFGHCRGDHIVTLDLDLSYDPPHIERLLERLRDSGAQIVLASPYMRGGRASHVPALRRWLSRSANRYLSLTAADAQVSTLTGMVRAYDAGFVRTLDLRARGMEIMPEIIYKTMMLNGRIEEIPAHLSWEELNDTPARRSSMKLARHAAATLLTGFMFKPVMFFVVPGLLLLAFALWVNAWTLIHFVEQFQLLAGSYDALLPRASAALEAAYDRHTHTFVVGLLALMLALQLIGLGTLSLQNKRYFEELYHLGSTIHKGVDRSSRTTITPTIKETR